MIGWDLITGLVVITIVSVLAYRVGKHLGRGVCHCRSLLFVESLALSLIFAWSLAGRLVWATAVPSSGVVYWSNLMPVFLGFTAGLATATPGLARWRRPFTVSLLALIAVVHLALPITRPLLAPAIVSANGQWREGICLQTHEATCGAAAAATLLNLNGLSASEQQMIQFCLTSRQGTEPLGLYRGLKLVSERSGRGIQVGSRDPNQWIAKHQLPNVALIRFSDSNDSGPIRRLLGPRGEGHAVVVLGFEDGQWILGDPAVGRVSWSDADFRRRFTGDMIFLASN